MVMGMPTDVRAQLATEIGQHKHEIASMATARMYETSYWKLRYGDTGRVTCLNDNLKHIEVFALAIRNQSPMIADTHVSWVRDLFIGLGMCTTYVSQALTYLQEAVDALVSPEAASAFGKIIQRGRGELVYRSPACQELIHHQDTIVELVTDTMYDQNPFWSLRYGEHGRASCKIDTYYNVAYLADALEADSTQGILIHTRWMRDFLISRGMCSQYYVEAWDELVTAARGVVRSEHHAAIDAVHAAVQANLKHDAPFARLIEQQREAILQGIARTHYDQSSDLQSRVSRSEFLRDVGYKLSFLVDADAKDDAAIFANYLDWVRDSLLFLRQTPQDLNANLRAIAQNLPADATPAQVRQWLQDQHQTATPEQAALEPAHLHAVVQDVQGALHGLNAVWHEFIPAHAHQRWSATVESALTHIAHATQPSAQPILTWLLGEMNHMGASRAYVLDFVEAAQHSLVTHLGDAAAAPLVERLQRGLTDLAEDDPALTLMQIPNLVDPILATLRDYSPYWQQQYQRRSAARTRHDVFVLIALLADDLMALTTVGFPAAADQHRQYLIKQGICTAYYQQLLDLTLEVLQAVVDEETTERATVLMDAANAILESDNPHILAVAEVQDPIVRFVIEYLQHNHPNWVSHYPGGWDDATTDMYYWLGYLADAMTFDKPHILTAHITWLHQYAQRTNQSGDHIRFSLVALGHAIKMHLPDHALPLLTTMSDALKRLNT